MKELVLLPETSGETSDLICVNMMCEHVGAPCICKLARCLTRCPNLKSLDLAGNKLGSLPESIAELQALTHLDVSGLWSSPK